MSVAETLRGALGGLNEALGNTGVAQEDFARRDQDRKNQLALKTAPLSQAIAADQQRLTTLKEGTPEYDQVIKRMALNIGQLRTVYGDTAPHDHPGRLSETVNMIRQHMKLGGKTPEQLQTDQTAKVGAYNAESKKEAGQYATAALPYEQTPEGQKLAEQERLRRESQKSNWQNFSDPNDPTKVVSVDVTNQSPPPGYVKAGTESTKAPVVKPKKGLKAMEQGGVAYGVDDQDAGVQYLPSQLGPNGNAPPEAKEIWKSIQDAQQAKRDAEAHKEDERDARQAKTLGAAFERMGQSQQFQENMAQYRSDLTTYRDLDKAANNGEVIVKSLEEQYKQPGNKAVADNELQNFYTTVVQKGGRKTAAELNLTLKIGSFGMNLQQMASKAATGELPDQLRKMLLDGMKAVAKEQRQQAESVKPTLPEITVPQGPKTKALKDKKAGGKSLADRLSEAIQ